VPVVVSGIIPVIQPFLQLTEPADLIRCQAFFCILQLLTELLVHVQYFRGLNTTVEQMAKQLHVHCRSGTNGRHFTVIEFFTVPFTGIISDLVPVFR